MARDLLPRDRAAWARFLVITLMLIGGFTGTYMFLANNFFSRHEGDALASSIGDLKREQRETSKTIDRIPVELQDIQHRLDLIEQLLLRSRR